MSTPPPDIERRLRQLPQPQVPGGLKQRVMAAASLAPRPSWRDRVWYSTPWRLAAAAMLVALLMADRWSAGAFRVEMAGPGPAAVEESTLVAAVGVEMGMPEQAMARLTSRVEFAGLTAQESREQAGAALR
jgi:hypothetical protein